MTVDVSRLPCGLNGAVYFVEMDADGGMAKSGGKNAAGAKYGTGYCDAQCPHDIKFIDGESNSDEWNSTSNPPVGKYGACCAEMDIWEANSRATAYTPHTCSKPGAYRCSGVECGDNEADERYDGVCDKDGCDFNSYRMGDTTFYGRKDSDAVNTREPLTVVTQFITNDGTDTGDLTEIRRLYVQNGDIIYNSNSTVPGVHGNSITDEFCREVKQAFGDVDDFGKKGGLKAMGEALDRGMVLVLSLWDDSLANMLWLDSKFPANESEAKLGVMRGPCSTTTGTPEHVRANFPHASVKFYDVKVGALDTTYGAGGGGIDDGDDEFGRDRRLGGVFV
jgi:cellulose 1,4-beta-cellobiosidase